MAPFVASPARSYRSQVAEKSSNNQSRVFCSSDHGTLDLGPIYAIVQGFIDQTNHTDVLATDNIEAQWYLN